MCFVAYNEKALPLGRAFLSRNLLKRLQILVLVSDQLQPNRVNPGVHHVEFLGSGH
jgi:hypothetical protein